MLQRLSDTEGRQCARWVQRCQDGKSTSIITIGVKGMHVDHFEIGYVRPTGPELVERIRRTRLRAPSAQGPGSGLGDQQPNISVACAEIDQGGVGSVARWLNGGLRATPYQNWAGLWSELQPVVAVGRASWASWRRMRM